VPNGAKGDSPITDITIHGLEVFGPSVDRIIADLAELGRSAELEAEVDLWTPRKLGDLAEQVQAVAARRPSIWVKLEWASTSAAAREPCPGLGWSWTSCVQLTDPAHGISDAWAMRFHIFWGEFPDGWVRALARFLSDRAPWDRLVPGALFWIVFAHRVLAKGVVESGPWY